MYITYDDDDDDDDDDNGNETLVGYPEKHLA